MGREKWEEGWSTIRGSDLRTSDVHKLIGREAELVVEEGELSRFKGKAL